MEQHNTHKHSKYQNTMTDSIKKTVVHISGCHLGTTFPEVDFNKDILGVNELERFLQEENYLTLYAILEEIELNKRIKFFRKAEEKDYSRLVIFTKYKPCTINDDNLLSSTQVSSMSGSPTMALYNSLSNVYTPLLDKEQQQLLQKHIHNMQAELRSSIFAKDSDFLQNNNFANSLTVVSSLEHEVQYWHMAATSTGKRDKLTKVACASFRDILTPLSRDFCVLDALSYLEVEDILERAHNVLDDLYRHEPPFPKERIKHLMDIIAQSLCKFISKQMESCDFWNGEFNEVMEVVQQFLLLSEKWCTTCKQLTEIFWPNYSGNLWREGVYVPGDLEEYVEVLRDGVSVRTVHKQLMRLLTTDEQVELKTKDMFKPFEDIPMFRYGELMPNSLLIAKKQFEILLQPAEKRVAMKLKKQLSTLNANTRQLLYEFSRYTEIINRPILKQALLVERQYLLNCLFDYIRTLQPKANLDNVNVLHGTETSQIVKEIVMIRQLETRVKEIQKVSHKILDDLQGFENIKQQVDELMTDLKQQHVELFQVWSSDTMSLIKDNTLSLRESDPVVQFSQKKYMRVNYSPKFVTLITEVRQLGTMGFHIASQIQQTADHAKKFMKHARILEQIANFHNTIGDRMIPSLKPLMLTSALELSKLVQEQEVVSWGDEPSVEKYVTYLKKAVEKLSRENELLTMYHNQILEKINELEDVDLIKDYSKWKENTRQIRTVVAQVEDKGFKNMQTWKNDLDKRLCKTLEKQYIKSLDTVHLYLPEIYADLVYRSREMTFSPTEEQLKKQYDQQLRKFLELPKHFRGISESSDIGIYGEIIDRNKDALEVVNMHTNELFQQLDGVKTHWQSWIQLENLDVTKLKTWQDWDLHFRSSKIFAQEVAKLPSTEEKIGCIIVGLSRLRSDLESHNRSYWDQLVYSLKDSIVEDVVKLQNFVDPSTAALTKQAVTLEELADSGISHSKILKEQPEMQLVFDEMLRKSQTLSSWSKEQIDSVNRLKGAWERLKSLIDSHHLIIEKQMENVKITLNIETENMTKELEHFAAKWDLTKPYQSLDISDNSLETMGKKLDDLKSKRSEWTEIVEKKEKLMSNYTKYNIDVPEIPLFQKISDDLTKDEANWSIFEDFYKELTILTNEYWIVFRKKIYMFEDFLSKWDNQLRDKNSEIPTMLQKEVEKYKEIFPFLKYVRGEDFTEKHWMDVFNLLNISPKPTDQLLLNDFLIVSDAIKQNIKQLQAISKKAASEIVVRQALTELDQWEVQARFPLNQQLDSQKKPIALIKDFKEILNKIGDNQSLLQSVKNSTDYGAFADKTIMWENKLMDLEYFVTSLAQIQRKWVYLEPIFSSGTLAHEKQRFDRIDRDVRHILSFIEKDNRVGALCRFSNLRSLLDTILEQLARCQTSLNNFLSEKRNKFPRFYFLSDEDLLEVVGQSSKEQVIQTHLKKLFAGVNSIQLEDSKIVALCSSEGEVVKLSTSINIQQPVEDWLESLVKEMHVTLKELLVLCQNEKEAPDPLKYPSQILCLSDNINFTLKCEQAISSMTLPSLLNKYKTQLHHYSSLELYGGEDKQYSSLNEVDDESKTLLETKLKALLLDTIHHIHVLESLIDSRTTRTADWMWQKQLRYYSNSLGVVTVKMANARMEYSYEYLGNAPKLVRTPLTDRCFLTLTQGMHLGMGGNPYGPAGTGKTESVKALGQLLGRQVLVFNCDEGIDASSMGRIISGLVRSGAWGCFDEFNRLEEATLSAVSMLIQPVQIALRNNQGKINLLNQEIQVNRHCGIFVTLNPAGGGYGGRNKLPDNLKQLFRPVVMTHPDQEEIARSLLHCDGYQNAGMLATKIIEVFDLSSKLLSKQQHYDWGLRAVRTILIGCGRSIKRQKLKENSEVSMDDELKIVVEVLRMNTLSKLTFSDSVKFDGIIKDVFKGTDLNMQYGNELLVKALEEAFEDLGLEKNKRQINKCLEFYEQLKQRMGVAIVGPPSCGKSTLRRLLFQALSKMKKILKEYPFNPKSMKRAQLLGYIDQDTKQWNDGVLTSYSLQVSTDSCRSWIVCDGDIDPDWIESLNSVLDDNRLLTLPSGWRIQFDKNVNFIFESHNLKHASPATISRMGIVFLSEEDLDATLYVKHFIKSLPEETRSILEPLIQDYLVKAVNWIFEEAELTISCSKIAILKTGLSSIKSTSTKSEFAVYLVNGLGQNLQYSFREMFVKQLFDWMGEAEPPLPLRCRYNRDRDIIDSYMSNSNITIENISQGLPLVITGQVAQNLDLLRTWLQPGEEQHFLMVGVHGSAKMLLLHHLAQERSNTEILTIHCSANLDPTYIINKLTQHCLSINTHKGKLYKPRKGHLLLYLKNLHLLKHDKWETNILIEFLNQIIVYNGFFDSNIEFIRLENVTIVGSLIETNALSERFTSNVHYCNISPPENEDFLIIITAYLTALIKEGYPNSNWPKTKITKLAMTLIEIYEKIRKVFTSVGHKHYLFSPHEVTKWCTSILRYKNEVKEDLEAFFLEILMYEALSIFGDKLATNEDRDRFLVILKDTVQGNWGKTPILQGYYYTPSPQVSNITSTLPLSKLNRDDWVKLVEQGLVLCEREGLVMDVMVNEELLNLTSTIAKSLTNLQENLVLIGRSGIGRRSSLKIVAALMSAKIFAPSSELSLDLKQAVQLAALEGEQVYLQVDDFLLSKEKNRDVLNMLISSGEVPGLFSGAELDSMVKTLKDEADRSNFDGSLLDFFCKRVKSNLHVVVCLDVKNVGILEHCPVLLEDSLVVWRNEWTLDSISQLPIKIIEKEDIKISEDFLKIYQFICGTNPEPSRFVSMIKLYVNIYLEKVVMITEKQKKLKMGVTKLKEAKQLVNELKIKADEQQQKLAEKQSKANSALDMISSTMKNANSQKVVMEGLKQKTEEENQQLIRRKKEIEEELSEVEPLVQEARSAVGNIKSESLSEIRSMRAPPDVIRDILEGVLRLMGIQDTSWNSMKTFLAKRGVKEEIRSFDASRITTSNRISVEKLMANKSDSFDPKVAKRASMAAAPLAAWVMANVKYSHVMDKIRPLELEQNKLQKNLEEAEMQLGELSSGLSDVDATVAKLKEKLSAYTKEAAAIEIDLNNAKETLNAAEGLVSKLDDEFQRWQIQYQELTEQEEKLPTNCLLAASFITYLSGETEHKRMEILGEWQRETKAQNFDFELFLSSERDHLQWQSQGLPSDRLSTQNAISILRSTMVPLIVDPTSTAILWLKKHINQKNVETLTQNSTKFATSLELAIRFGKTLIIEEIEDVPSIIHPLLRGEFSQQGERLMVKLNGKSVDYNSNFKLILCSRNEQLKINADVLPLVNLFNFTVTKEGLTDQLLFDAIKQENPDLETRRKVLLSEREKMQDKQETYQNQLLEDLANSSGDILQNKSLIQSLNETKASSSAISVALAESMEIQKKMQEEYDAYKEISSFGSKLFFSCNAFSRSSVLYLISVSAFNRLFLKNLENLQVMERNTQVQIKNLFATVYNYMARGIFKQDRIKFMLHLAHELFPKDIPELEWNVYLNNRISNRQTNEEIPPWIPRHSVNNVQNLIVLTEFYESLKLNEAHLWTSFMSSADCENNFPEGLKLSEFQKVLVVQALRPDRLYSVSISCVLHITGVKSLDPPNFELSHILRESIPGEPILVLSMPGTDPSTQIKDLAEIRFLEIAMGEGQEDNALKALKDTAREGHWLILKNLHLATNWLPVLCQTLKDLEKHQDFRLWLVSEPTSKFSSVLTQNSLKIVYEAPQGIKNNLQRSFAGFGPRYLENLNGTSARIFFVICCVHALLQERRKYIPQGWSKLYDFSDTDLSTCIKLVEDLWQTPTPQIQWKFISGLCAETVYGGRIEKLDDMKILEAYVKQYFVDEILSHRWKPFGKINLPNSTNYNDYVTSILQLPAKDIPSYFGLPENIDRAWETQNSQKIIKELKEIYLVKQSFTNFDREIFQKGLSTFMNLWKKLNQGYDFIRMTIPTETKKSTAIETFISEEFVNALNFVHQIHKSFATLNKICKGYLTPNAQDMEVGSSLLNFETPRTWLNIWSGPKEPTQYLKTIIRNLIHLTKINEETPEKLLKNPINLSLFFNPRGFLASHKQDVSRMTNTAIDQLHLQTNWRNQDPNGIILSNLLVEGGYFEGTTLKACTPNTENINQAPQCYLDWKPRNIEETDKFISTPLYTRSDRDDKLIYLNMFDDGKDKDAWILRGLAFYLEL